MIFCAKTYSVDMLYSGKYWHGIKFGGLAVYELAVDCKLHSAAHM